MPGNYPGQEARRLSIHTPYLSVIDPRLPPGNWACNVHWQSGLWKPKNSPSTKMQVLTRDSGAGIGGNHKGIWGNRHLELVISVEVSVVKKLAQGHPDTIWWNYDIWTQATWFYYPFYESYSKLSPLPCSHIKCSSVVAIIVIIILVLGSHR